MSKAVTRKNSLITKIEHLDKKIALLQKQINTLHDQQSDLERSCRPHKWVQTDTVALECVNCGKSSV